MARVCRLVNVLTRFDLVDKRRELGLPRTATEYQIAKAFCERMMRMAPRNFSFYQVEFGWNRTFQVHQAIIRYYGVINEWELSDWNGWCDQEDEPIGLF